MDNKLKLSFLLILLACQVFAQQKHFKAFRTQHAVKIDGILNENEWAVAEVANNFIVNQPQFGATASQSTEVKVLYDDNAIYVSAYLHDDPTLIRRQMTLRDGEQRQDVDVFGVAFDTYHDGQNAFMFMVTAANVQSDAKLSGNFNLNNGVDYNWDAVWDSHVNIVNDGWIVEIKIPYMSLRFAQKNVQDWGVNFYRSTRRLNEVSYWNPVNPNIAGLVNQFGVLSGLENLQPPLRLSFLPYVSAGYSTVPTATGTIKNVLHNGGMDVKYGINESFTLDMTLVPDFGQTLSDNVILNLSPYEVQFAENRPFFTEGTELFNKAGIFYSRRIGKTPTLYDSINQLAVDSGYTILQNPSLTQLYNATKFSGRTKHNLGIGVFNAVTAPMFADVRDNKGSVHHIETEPLSNYNIIVLDQALANRSSISFTNTNVIRRGGDQLANVSAVDLRLFDKANQYSLQSKAAYSTVGGAYAHNGFKLMNSFGKVSGLWQWNFSNNIESDQYDPNDLGYLKAPNEVSYTANVSYNQYKPGKNYNFKIYSFSLKYQNLYKPYSFSSLYYYTTFLKVFKNFYDAKLVVEGSPVWSNDYFELRTPGAKLKRVPYVFSGVFGSSDSRKKLFFNYGIGYATAYDYSEHIPYSVVTGGIRFRFNNQFSVSLNSKKEFDAGEFGWVFFESGTNVPVIGQRRVIRMDNVFNAIYNFQARMNVTLRVRHYWSRVHYVKMFHVDSEGNFQNLEIPVVPGYDNNFNALNVDAFYTWDFRLGSRLIIAWKNAIGPDVTINGEQYKKYMDNLFEAFASPLSNQISAKFIYFIDYNQLRRNKSVQM
ncbi:DUF5916 domain-containing protein [Hydrotalea sandarakina]|jgi:hypothetical protein|uniref:Carbohydrate binding protein with CBM9 domain n=1 Tax=Hydrotalea sandarakina TaxID=1004304 RepID=A0A2W7RXF2_9BACT|nr:DUF5916 domain-containing protein [Hydrotalea sandarakina]PZX63506.1 carbohydrate binding protein with CBM9 domain [Hydrotalea sandarakina]